MTRQFWINLPVKDMGKSKFFYQQIGFKLNTQYGGKEDSASFLIGDKDVVLMLFAEETFRSFTGNGIADTADSIEALFSIDAESKEEVDELVRKAVAAGGKSTHEPKELQGWMYGCVFADPDGHCWNVLYMDMSKMPSY